MRTLLIAALALAIPLGACDRYSLPAPATAEAVGASAAAAADAAGAKAPAPLKGTPLDEQAVITALNLADTIASQVDALVATGKLVPGTPRALAVRDGLVRLRSLLVAASAAQRAGNADTYAEAFRGAAAATRSIAAAIRGQ